jgi:hypothetical protein
MSTTTIRALEVKAVTGNLNTRELHEILGILIQHLGASNVIEELAEVIESRGRRVDMVEGRCLTRAASTLHLVAQATAWMD